MKRTIAKEFLLLVGCIVVVLLVALFGWARNAWLNHRIENAGSERAEQMRVLESLAAKAQPLQHDFVDLFDSVFVRRNFREFLITPFSTMDPFDALDNEAKGGWVLVDVKPGTIVADPFNDASSQRPPPQRREISYPSHFSRRYLTSLANVLNSQQYLTPARVARLAAARDSMKDAVPEWKRKLESAARQSETSNPILKAARAWKPPPDAVEVYNPLADIADELILLDGLKRRGVPVDRDSLDRSPETDSVEAEKILRLLEVMMYEPTPHQQLQSIHAHLKDRHVLNCTFDELLCTLQRKPVPPTKEMLDAVSKQRATVGEWVREQDDARMSLWSEAKQWAVVKWAAIILLALVYPLRFLVLGTRWALRTVRAS